MDVRTAKQAATLDIASPDTCQCLKPPFEPFKSPWIHPCYNQPRVGRLKFRLETNSTVVRLYVGSVSLILLDVRFGTVSPQIQYFIAAAKRIFFCGILVRIDFPGLLCRNFSFLNWMKFQFEKQKCCQIKFRGRLKFSNTFILHKLQYLSNF